MIKVQVVDNRGFVKRSWKDERNLQAKLKMADASLIENVEKQSSKHLASNSVWGGIKKLGSSIINKFRKQNPETTVNVDFTKSQGVEDNLRTKNDRDRDRNFSQSSSMEVITEQNNRKYKSRLMPFDVDKLKQPSNKEFAFVELPKKKRISDQHQRNIYRVDCTIPIDSFKKNINSKIDVSARVSRIANDVWSNNKDLTIKNTNQKDKIRKKESNQDVLNLNVDKSNSALNLDRVGENQRNQTLSWLDKLAKQSAIRQQAAKIKQLEVKKSALLNQAVLDQKGDNQKTTTTLTNNQPKLNLGLFESNKVSLDTSIPTTLPSKPSLFNNDNKSPSDVSSIIKPTQPEGNLKTGLFGGLFGNKQTPANSTKDTQPAQNKTVPQASLLFSNKGGLFDNKTDNQKITTPIKEKQSTQKADEVKGLGAKLFDNNPKQSVTNPELIKKPSQTVSPSSLLNKDDATIPTIVTPTKELNKEKEKQAPKQSPQYLNVFVTPKQFKPNFSFQQLFGVQGSDTIKNSSEINNPFKKGPVIENPLSMWNNTKVNLNPVSSSGGMETEDTIMGNGDFQNQNHSLGQFSPGQSNPSYVQLPYNFSPSQTNFTHNTNGLNLGTGLLSGAISFFQQQKQEPQSLFSPAVASPKQPAPSRNKSKQQRAFQN